MFVEQINKMEYEKEKNSKEKPRRRTTVNKLREKARDMRPTDSFTKPLLLSCCETYSMKTTAWIMKIDKNTRSDYFH